jgi:hypothetical protein
MKIGFIFECGRDGADSQVCRYFAERLTPGIVVVSQFMDNKPNLLENCGPVASLLIEDCDRVIIIWDLYPAWRETFIGPCRKEDREKIFASLQSCEVPLHKVVLVCIEEELEAWLLADKRALKTVLTNYKHPHRVGNLPNLGAPERIPKPKTRLTRIFNQELGAHRRYIDHQDAIRIAEAIPDFNKIKRSTTFRRFAEKAVGITL